MKQFIYLLVLLFIVACSRGGSAAVELPGSDLDTTFPVVEVSRPLPGQQFRSGDSLKIEGKASDIGLHAGVVRVIDDASGSVLKQQAFDLHTLQTYQFSVSHVIRTTVTANYTVRIDFEDHSSNHTIRTIAVKADP